MYIIVNKFFVITFTRPQMHLFTFYSIVIFIPIFYSFYIDDIFVLK